VVRHLEDIGAEVGPRGDEGALGLHFGVAGQEDAHAGDLGPQDQRRVVGIGAGAVERAGRTEHVEVNRADIE
jgi:hypothetical protein